MFSRSPSRSASPMSYYPALDGLRALAILLVLAQHGSYGHVPGGFVGVDVFFVLSGFLITRVLLQPNVTIGDFYLRRVRRLMPALICLLILAFILWPLSLFPSLSYVRAALPAALYVADFQACINPDVLGPMLPTWSLAVEEQFYLLWPMALAALTRLAGSNRVRWTLALAVIFAISRPFFYLWWPSAMKYYSPLTRVDVLLLGCAMGAMALPPRMTVVAYAFLAIVPILAFKMLSSSALHYIAVAPLVACGSAALISECVRSDGSLIKRLFSTPLLVWIGRRSYGIYLYHLPLFEALEHFRRPHSPLNFFCVTAARLLVLVFVAEASYKLIERPILTMRFGKKSSPVAH
jgi:peptidoglycan/LPS O-acetylase OafA/YrhL